MTSFLSLCFGFVTFRKMAEEEAKNEDWTWKDVAVDMVWNIFSVSPRVITLAVFASFELYWFWGLVITQFAFIVILITAPTVCVLCTSQIDVIGFIGTLMSILFIAIGWVFNMFVFLTTVGFPVYLLYWVVMFVENTIIISLWHQRSRDLRVWYHNLFLLYDILSYALSLIIKSVHCYFYKNNRNEKNIYMSHFSYSCKTEEKMTFPT